MHQSISKKKIYFYLIILLILSSTSNFDLISNAITNGIMQLSIIKKKPIGNSIITAFNREQGMKRFHRGEESAKAVLKVLKIK